MARRRLLIEEYHLGFLVPEKTSEVEAEAIRRVLASRAFRAEMLRVAREMVASRPDPLKVTSTLTR